MRAMYLSAENREGLNLPLIRQTAAYMRQHPGKVNQDHWCGTTCCTAGHLLAQAGVPEALQANTRPATNVPNQFTLPSGEVVDDVEIAAAMVAGLPEETAFVIFYTTFPHRGGLDQAETMAAILEAIAGGANHDQVFEMSLEATQRSSLYTEIFGGVSLERR